MTDNDIPIDLTGATVFLVVKKPSDLVEKQECTVTTAENGQCEILLLNSAYNEKGYYKGELLISNEESIATTMGFEYLTLNAISNNETTTQNLKLWKGTLAEYNEIVPKDEDTIYLTTE